MLDTIPTDVLLYLGAWLRFSEVLVLRSVSKSFRDRLTVQRILSTRPGFEKLAFSEYVWFEDKSYGHYRSGGTKKMLFSSFSESRNEEISSIGINFSAGVHRLVYDHEDGCGQCNWGVHAEYTGSVSAVGNNLFRLHLERRLVTEREGGNRFGSATRYWVGSRLGYCGEFYDRYKTRREVISTPKFVVVHIVGDRLKVVNVPNHEMREDGVLMKIAPTSSSKAIVPIAFAKVNPARFPWMVVSLFLRSLF